MGVEQCTLARWERGEREPTGVFLDRVNRFLANNLKLPSSQHRRAG